MMKLLVLKTGTFKNAMEILDEIAAFKRDNPGFNFN